jgi:hypothetical protein
MVWEGKTNDVVTGEKLWFAEYEAKRTKESPTLQPQHHSIHTQEKPRSSASPFFA